MITLNETISRAKQWGHSDSGRVITALKEIFATPYPAGTNLELVFLDKMRGIPYGAIDRCMDVRVDCAELYRITFFIFHGIDIGSFSDAVYKSNLGVTISTTFADIYTANPLDLVLYDTSNEKITGHLSGVYDANRIIHSGARENGAKVDYSLKSWGKSDFICIRRFLSDEQIASVTVGSGQPIIEPKKWTCSRILKPGMRGLDIYSLELALESLGLDCGITKKEHANKIGIFGLKCRKALIAWQKKNLECGTRGKPDGQAGKKSVEKLGGEWIWE